MLGSSTVNGELGGQRNFWISLVVIQGFTGTWTLVMRKMEPLTCESLFKGNTFGTCSHWTSTSKFRGYVQFFLIFTPGEMIHFEEHIFQMGWNHHLHSLKLTQCLKIDRPKRKRSYSNHPFSGAICEFHGEYIASDIPFNDFLCLKAGSLDCCIGIFLHPRFGPSTFRKNASQYHVALVAHPTWMV